MYRSLLILLILLFFTQGNTEEVNKLVIEGNKRVSEETIKVYGEIELNKDITESDLNRITTNLFSTNFFEDVSVQIKSNTLIINVSEYPVINQLVILGEDRKSYLEEIKKIISLKENKSFTRSSLAKDILKIKIFIQY